MAEPPSVDTPERAPDEDGADAQEQLSRQLAQAFGAPAACLSEETRESLRSDLTIQVSVRVLPSGNVSSARVSGARLSDEDRACLVHHAEGLRLPGPIEDAPRSVSASVRYEVQDTRTTRTVEPTVPDRQLPPGAATPGLTLPATGTDSERRPAAPAGTTLPAAGSADGRPRGFVAPGSTLPARGN